MVHVKIYDILVSGLNRPETRKKWKPLFLFLWQTHALRKGRLAILFLIGWPVAAPQALNNKVEPAYFTCFTGVQRMYSRLEKKPLETAAYRPLIQKKAVEITEREVIGLSTQGKKGANLRSGPGTSYAVPRELKGNVPEGRMVSCEGE